MQKKKHSAIPYITLILSAIAQWFFVAENKIGNVLWLPVFIYFAAAVLAGEARGGAAARGEAGPDKKAIVITALLQLSQLSRFIIRWPLDHKFRVYAKALGMPNPVLAALIGTALALPGFYFTLKVIEYFLSETKPAGAVGEAAKEPAAPTEGTGIKDAPQRGRAVNLLSKGNRKVILLCILCAVIAMTICSECSFMYPINSHADPNIFMTVGKGWVKGLLPYRDLYEQKGPIHYMIYGAAYLLTGNNYYGIYLIEIVLASAFLYLICLTCELFGEKRYYLVVPLAAIAVYTSKGFRTGGNSEEVCMPLLAYGLYLGLAYLSKHRKPRFREYVLLGVSLGLVFWNKFTFVGFYVGWFLFFSYQYIKRKEVKEFRNMFLGFAAGFVLLTVPVLLLFAANGAIVDLFKVYFYDNIFLYSEYQEKVFLVSLITNYAKGLGNLVDGSFFIFLLIVLGLLRDKTRFMATSMAFLFSTSFIGEHIYTYYAFIFAPFVGRGIAVMLEKAGAGVPAESAAEAVPVSTAAAAGPVGAAADNAAVVQDAAAAGQPVNPDALIRRHAVAAMIVFAGVCYVLTPNQERFGMKKADTPQYQMAEIIHQSEDQTLLNYGFLDNGFYMAADVLPTCKAFCRTNMPHEEMLALQEEYLMERKCEFVVTNKRLDKPLYELYDMVLKSGIYRLYQRKK